MTTFSEIAEVITAIAIGVITALVISGFILIIFILRKNRDFYKNYFEHAEEIMPRRIPQTMLEKPRESVLSITDSEYYAQTSTTNSDINSNTLQINEGFEKAFSNDQWLDDMHGLVPHCLAILKICRTLTERLTTMAMGILNVDKGHSLKQIVDCARKISSKVDDMVHSMYPPLDPAMLEARAVSLMLAVAKLAVLAQYECRSTGLPMNWVDDALREIEKHLSVLKRAASETGTNIHFSDSSSLSSGIII